MTTATDILTLTAPASLQARDASKPATASILAYTGGIMVVPGWGPVVLEASGLELGKVKLLLDHDASEAGVLGSGNASTDGRRVVVSGSISRHSQAGPRVIAMSNDGVDWQASVGVTPKEGAVSRVHEGETIHANGQTLTAGSGGFAYIKQGKLREVSITALGADGDTAVSIKGQAMSEPTTQTSEAVAKPAANDPAIEAQAARWENIGAITAIGEQYPAQGGIIAQAIREDWPASRALTECIRAARPEPTFNVNTGAGSPALSKEVLSAAFSLRFDGSKCEADYDEKTLEAADRYRNFSFYELASESLRAAGQDVRGNKFEVIEAAGVSTMNLPLALGDSRAKALAREYRLRPASYRDVGDVRSASDFHRHRDIRTSEFDKLKKLGSDAEFRHTTMTESADIEYQLETSGEMIGVSRTMLVNDDLSVFDAIPRKLARSTTLSIGDDFWGSFINAPAGYFVAGENRLTGAASALSISALTQALTLLRTQRDDKNNDLEFTPMHLVVAPENETLALELVQSTAVLLAMSGTTDDIVTRPAGNGLAGLLRVVVEPRLSNTQKFPAASPNNWIVTAAPFDSPAFVAYLNGNASPTAEYFGFDKFPTRLQVAWRIFIDYDCSLGERKASVWADGQ